MRFFPIFSYNYSSRNVAKYIFFNKKTILRKIKFT